MLSDLWIDKNSPIDRERLHALGVIVYRWNACETTLFFLFVHVMRLDVFIAKALVHQMTEAALADRIRDVLLARPIFTPPDIGYAKDLQEEALYSLELFHANRINRNTLMHFLPTAGPGGVEFWRTKGADFKPKPIPNSLADIRRVAEEMKQLGVYMSAVTFQILQVHGGPPAPVQLPERPHKPTPLWNPP